MSKWLVGSNMIYSFADLGTLSAWLVLSDMAAELPRLHIHALQYSTHENPFCKPTRGKRRALNDAKSLLESFNAPS